MIPLSIVVIPFKSIAGVEPDTVRLPIKFVEPETSKPEPETKSEPDITASPEKGKGFEVTPVIPLPSPTNEPENTEPDIATVSVKSATTDEPETIREPVITASPL